ncbi:hypothetical protein BG57_20135 [Caballeronia grimmiae]|nr:hypothetical protein BG57_20135 [Caballeronia grimmiae]
MRGMYRDYSQMEAAAVLHVRPRFVPERNASINPREGRLPKQRRTNATISIPNGMRPALTHRALTSARNTPGSPTGANAMGDAQWQALARICAA